MQDKFAESESPSYDTREIFPEELERERKIAKKIKYNTLAASSKIRVMVIKHNTAFIKVAPYLCDKWQNKFGSCTLFQELKLESSENRNWKSCTRRDLQHSSDNDDGVDDEEVIVEQYAPDTVCAVAADHHCLDLLYFIYIVNSDVAEVDMTDSFKHDIKAGQEYKSGYYLEKQSETLKGITYTINKKIVFSSSKSLLCIRSSM